MSLKFAAFPLKRPASPHKGFRVDITFVQTADADFYYPMLHETSRTVRSFCSTNGLKYESYVGIKRGSMPWNAAYNRVYMLKEMVDRGCVDWVFYMDADAYIHDMDFDVRRYLSDKLHYAGIFSGYCASDLPFDINSGGFAINLGHAVGRQLALDYWKSVDDIPDRDFRHAVAWGQDIPEDQYLLHRLLADYYESKLLGEAFLFERNDEGFTNHGPFIRQALRSKSPDFQSRMAFVKQQVDDAMRGRPEAKGNEQPGYYLRGSNSRIRLANGRRKLGAIHSVFQAGYLTFGPYIPLRAGNYAIKIFGHMRQAADGRPMALMSDMVSDEGNRIWAEGATSFAQPTKGLLVEHRVSLTHDVAMAEVRTKVDEFQDLSIYAIQFQWLDSWVRET